MPKEESIKAMDFTIRGFKPEDMTQLKLFFKKAYGERTVFQDEKFLNYYFEFDNNGLKNLNACTLAVTASGEVVSFYGGLEFRLQIGTEMNPIIWGVNAFTLPEYRGRGINGKIVSYMHGNFDMSGVIGMTLNAAVFYQKLGYHGFDLQRFSRYICALDECIFEVVGQMGQDQNMAKTLIQIQSEKSAKPISPSIQKITRQNFKRYSFAMNSPARATTVRDKKFLEWRFFNNPYIDYEIFGFVQNDNVSSYIAIREEILQPTGRGVSRIIDIFGDPNEIPDLLAAARSLALEKQHLYLDFSMFGTIYAQILKDFGFSELHDENYALLPQVTAPIENRPNHEYLLLQSKLHQQKLNQLKKEDVYFTRIDSDRDRISRIDQCTQTSM